MGDGSDYQIEESYEYEDDEDYECDKLPPHLKIADMKIAAGIVRDMPVGSWTGCPVCGKEFRKKTKHHTFCSNGRQKKGGNCKDRYWNTVDEGRKERGKIYR